MNEALPVTTSLTILRQDVKAISDRAVDICDGRTTLAQQLSTGYLDKFK